MFIFTQNGNFSTVLTCHFHCRNLLGIIFVMAFSCYNIAGFVFGFVFGFVCFLIFCRSTGYKSLKIIISGS